MTGQLGYQSAWTDAASGKDLMGARWYNPGDGDFTSADTVTVSPDPDPAAGNPFAYAADEPLDLVDPTGHYIVPPPNAGTSERIGNDVSSPSNFVADVATARVVEHAVITAPNNAAKAAAAHAALAKVEAEQANAKKAAIAAAQKAARAAATRRAALALARRKTATREAAQNSAQRLLIQKLAMSEAVDVGGGKNITPPGEDLGNETESIPVGDWDIEILGNPGHQGPNNDITVTPDNGGPRTIINAEESGGDKPGDGPSAGEGDRFIGYTDRPPTDELPELNTNVRFVSKEGELPIDLANPLALADRSGEPDLGLESSNKVVEAGENLSDLVQTATGAVDRGHEILYPGRTRVPTSPGNVSDAPVWGGLSPSGASAVVTSVLAIWILVQWVRKAIGG